MLQLRELKDLPESQQKTLDTLLRFQKPAFRTSEVLEKMGKEMTGRSVGAVLGSLYRNKYLDKVQGGRDKMWKLSQKVEAERDDIKKQLGELKVYWG